MATKGKCLTVKAARLVKSARCMSIGMRLASAHEALIDASFKLGERSRTKAERAHGTASRLGTAVRDLEDLRRLNGSVWKKASPIHKSLERAERILRVGELNKKNLEAVRDRMFRARYGLEELETVAAQHCGHPKLSLR